MQTAFNFTKDMNKVNWGRFNSVFLIEVTRGDKVFTSTAVAISPNKILTAAHSIDGADSVRLMIGHDYNKGIEFIPVSYWIIHPGYNPSKSFYQNDLAVMYTAELLPVFISYEEIEQIDLEKQPVIIERVGFGGRGDDNIKTWTNPEYVSQTFDKKNYVLRDSHSVIGDSGGPVYWVEHGVHKLVGLHSTLEGNSKTYIVNLHFYKDWIDNLEFDSQIVS